MPAHSPSGWSRVQVAASVAMTIKARELRAAGMDVDHADHRRAEFRQPAARDRGGAPGGAARRDEVSAAGRHAAR